jgi:hypothetical protein
MTTRDKALDVAFLILVISGVLFLGCFLLGCNAVTLDGDGLGTVPGADGAAGMTFTQMQTTDAQPDDTSADGGDPETPQVHVVAGCSPSCQDFPQQPILSDGVTPDLVAMFNDSVGQGNPPPCIIEPQPETLYPSNWNHLQIKLGTGTGPFKVFMHVDGELNDLVAYVSGNVFDLDGNTWRALATNVPGQQVTVKVTSPGSAEATTSFAIAPVAVTDKISFSAEDIQDLDQHAPIKNSNLRQISIGNGDAPATVVLNIADVQMKTTTSSPNTPLRSVSCLGCHVDAPDGLATIFEDTYPWNMAVASLKPDEIGAVPSFVTAGGQAGLRQPGLGISTISRSHFSPGDRIVVAPYYLDDPSMPTLYSQQKANVQLAWFDLEAASVPYGGYPVAGKQFGIIARNGDPRGAASPAFSNDGTTIAYASTNSGIDGRLSVGATDIYTVKYNNRAGGDAVPLAGAASDALEEYYPAFSSDDQIVGFTTVPAGESMYQNPHAEVYVLPATGRTPIRLKANDPVTCSGVTSPGVNNNWTRFSTTIIAGGKTYQFVVFSSGRDQIAPPATTGGMFTVLPQLYIAAIVVEDGVVKDYPAIRLPGQPVDRVNVAPSWNR